MDNFNNNEERQNMMKKATRRGVEYTYMYIGDWTDLFDFASSKCLSDCLILVPSCLSKVTAKIKYPKLRNVAQWICNQIISRVQFRDVSI